MPHAILVLANKTCPCPELRRLLVGRADAHDALDVLVVAPALNSRLAHYVSDSDRAVTAAQERLEVALVALRGEGVPARGAVGDAQPLLALEDALADFAPDEIVISTHPPGQSHWLERHLLERARERVEVPVVHLTTEYGLEAPV